MASKPTPVLTMLYINTVITNVADFITEMADDKNAKDRRELTIGDDDDWDVLEETIVNTAKHVKNLTDMWSVVLVAAFAF